jgi:hypothetical protein
VGATDAERAAVKVMGEKLYKLLIYLDRSLEFQVQEEYGGSERWRLDVRPKQPYRVAQLRQ